MMKDHTSMKVGGPADSFYTPSDEEELIAFVRSLNDSEKPYILLGNGTNIIVRDGGYRGAVISTLKALRGIEVKGDSIVCGAGESLAKVCRFSAENSLSGMETLSGIPGTVGGAVFMNAGAYEKSISDILIFVRAYDMVDNKNIMLTNDECLFSYRNSCFRTRPLIILSAEFLLTKNDREIIENLMSDYTKKRNEKQPVELPSSGSFFKRPEGDYAGRLIEKAGLKGTRIGGAQISEKHAGFIVNIGGATAKDVIDLSEMIKYTVYEKFQIKLEEEPIVIGI